MISECKTCLSSGIDTPCSTKGPRISKSKSQSLKLTYNQSWSKLHNLHCIYMFMQCLLVFKYFYYWNQRCSQKRRQKYEETVFLDDSFQDKFIGQFEKLTFQSYFNHCIKKFLTKRLTNMGFCSPKKWSICEIILWHNWIMKMSFQKVC